MTSYEHVLQSEVHAAQVHTGEILLPLDSEVKFYTLFSSVLTRRGAALHWSRVRLLKSALLQHHARSSSDCVLHEWSRKMAAFWSGLARNCIHESIGKQPITFGEVATYLEKNHADLSLPVMRNAAMVTVGFFGVRRGAELINFRLADVLEVSDRGVHLKVTCQKNDQLGL